MAYIEKKSPDGKTTQRLWVPDATPKPAYVPPSTADIKATADARNAEVIKKTAVPQPAGTVVDPQKALADRAASGSEAPISPYVKPATPTPDVVTPAATPTPGATSTITNTNQQQATDELTPGTDAYVAGQDKLFEIAQEDKDAKIANLTELHDAQIARLDELQKMMEELTSQKNTIITGSSDVQRAEVEAAYEANSNELKIAQQRLEQTKSQILSEKEQQLARKTINEENMIAVIGGFGSMAGNKYLLDSVEQGNKALGDLKVEFSIQQNELTNKVVELNNTFKTDNMKIEQWKSEQIMKNYENLQSYVASIMEDENKADAEKVQAINAATDQYNTRIANIHSDVLKARFDLSRDIITRTSQIAQESQQKIENERNNTNADIATVRADLALLSNNYAMEDYTKLPQEVTDKISELETKAGLPKGFVQQAIKNLKDTTKASDVQILNQTNANGDWTIVAYDKKTNKIVNQTQILGAGKPVNNTNTGKTPAVRNFNPGNLRSSSTQTGTSGGFAQFSSYTEGFNALMADLKAKQTGASKTGLGPNSTLAQLIAVYAPVGDGNDPVGYANAVAAELGITPDTKISAIDTEKLAMSIAKHEDPEAYKLLVKEMNPKVSEYDKDNFDNSTPSAPAPEPAKADSNIIDKINGMFGTDSGTSSGGSDPADVDYESEFSDAPRR